MWGYIMGKRRLDLQFKCWIILLSSCLIMPTHVVVHKQVFVLQKQTVKKTIVQPKTVIKPVYANITAVGDTICHDRINAQAYSSINRQYHYSSLFTNIKSHFQGKDLCIANLETTINPRLPVHGYPNFNAPSSLIDDLKALGIHMVSTANNHCLDTGYDGLVSTIDTLNEKKMDHTGTYKSAYERDTILMKNLNGIQTAFLSFTYGTNHALAKSQSYSVNVINKDEMKRQIDLAKKAGAQAIVVSMHWGVEYQLKENQTQDDLAQFLIQNGVNVILGSHPHVLQPMKRLTVKDAQGQSHEGFVIYSLGNFFSSQVAPHTHESVILDIRLKKEKQVTVDQVHYTPLYNAQNGRSYTLYDLDQVISSYEKGNPQRYSAAFYNQAKKEKAQIASIMGGDL